MCSQVSSAQWVDLAEPCLAFLLSRDTPSLTGSQAKERWRERHLGFLALLEAVGPCCSSQTGNSGKSYHVNQTTAVLSDGASERHALHESSRGQARGSYLYLGELLPASATLSAGSLGLDGETTSPDACRLDPVAPVMMVRELWPLASSCLAGKSSLSEQSLNCT